MPPEKTTPAKKSSSARKPKAAPAATGEELEAEPTAEQPKPPPAKRRSSRSRARRKKPEPTPAAVAGDQAEPAPAPAGDQAEPAPAAAAGDQLEAQPPAEEAPPQGLDQAAGIHVHRRKGSTPTEDTSSPGIHVKRRAPRARPLPQRERSSAPPATPEGITVKRRGEGDAGDKPGIHIKRKPPRARSLPDPQGARTSPRQGGRGRQPQAARVVTRTHGAVSTSTAAPQASAEAQIPARQTPPLPEKVQALISQTMIEALAGTPRDHEARAELEHLVALSMRLIEPVDGGESVTE